MGKIQIVSLPKGGMEGCGAKGNSQVVMSHSRVDPNEEEEVRS